MSFEEYKKENYPNGCIIHVLYGKGVNIERPLQHAYEAGLHADVHTDNSKVIAELETQIEKLIAFVLSKIECCDVCPITDTCINSEGTCPYAGILANGEEEVTREWLMQFISRR